MNSQDKKYGTGDGEASRYIYTAYFRCSLQWDSFQLHLKFLQLYLISLALTAALFLLGQFCMVVYILESAAVSFLI